MHCFVEITTTEYGYAIGAVLAVCCGIIYLGLWFSMVGIKNDNVKSCIIILNLTGI